MIILETFDRGGKPDQRGADIFCAASGEEAGAGLASDVDLPVLDPGLGKQGRETRQRVIRHTLPIRLEGDDHSR